MNQIKRKANISVKIKIVHLILLCSGLVLVSLAGFSFWAGFAHEITRQVERGVFVTTQWFGSYILLSIGIGLLVGTVLGMTTLSKGR